MMAMNEFLEQKAPSDDEAILLIDKQVVSHSWLGMQQILWATVSGHKTLFLANSATSAAAMTQTSAKRTKTNFLIIFTWCSFSHAFSLSVVGRQSWSLLHSHLQWQATISVVVRWHRWMVTAMVLFLFSAVDRIRD
jgi:hypothetical protein